MDANRLATFALWLCNFVLAGLLLGGCAKQNPAPVSELSLKKEYSSKTRSSYKKSRYKVKKGDTLYSIAWLAGKDFRKVATFNKLEPPYIIYPGQILKLQDPTPVSASATRNKSPAKAAVNKKPSTPVPSQSNQKVDQIISKRYPVETPVEPSPKKKPSYPSKVNRWNWPHKGKVIGGFSSREHGNKGIDIAGRKHDQIRAAAAGKVVYAGSALEGFGNLLIIKHSEEYLTAYAHLSRFRVKEQQWIKGGQVIADMGSSDADRVKLHFEIRYRGKSVNPTRYLPKR